tara:strand:+ start:1767 stop:2681 length:915 start_codon:yes stop_codon:yes gene_type:complete
MGKKILIERCNQWGFFSAFMQVLDNLRWCEQNDHQAIIEWGNDSQYYSNDGYNGSTNVWEYYFEQLPTKLSDNDIIKDNHNSFLLKEIPQNFGHRNIQTSGLRVKPDWNIVDDYWRREANRVITKYISIKPNVEIKINNFVKEHLSNNKTKIAIHLRGGRGAKELYHKDNVRLEYYKEYVNKWISEHNITDYCIFVASDSNEAIKFISDNFENVKSYPCHRTDDYYINDVPYHKVQEVGWNPAGKQFMPEYRALIGEEALIESQLLSKCDIMFHHDSLLAIGAANFNPDMQLMHVENYIKDRHA